MDVPVRSDIKKIATGNPHLSEVQQVPACIFALLSFSFISPRQPDRVSPIHVLALFGFCFISTPLSRPLVLVAGLVCQLPFSVFLMPLACLESLSLNCFSIELVLCPFHCSLSALWFPAVSSRHQLTFSSVFRMTTNSSSRQPVSASSPKPSSLSTVQTHASDFVNALLWKFL